MSAYWLHDASWARIVAHRVREPHAIEARLASRRRPELSVPADGRLVLIAANHCVDPRSEQAVGRRELLARIVEALSVAGVDGVVASPDLIEELTLLNVLEHRVAFATHASGNHVDGRVVSTSDEIDPAVLTILRLRARTIAQPEVDSSWTDWIDSLHEATSTAITGAGLWLSVPPVRGLSNLAEASAFPLLIRDIDVPIDPSAWAGFFATALPDTVRGIVLGVSALFPHEGSVAAATAAIAGSARTPQANADV